jgi:hypothetical protein
MFYEMGYSVHGIRFIPCAGMNKYSAMCNRVIDLVMDQPDAVGKGEGLQFHELFPAFNQDFK